MTPNESQYPYDTLVLVISTIGGVTYQGSGVLISPDEVLTASHVVYGAGVGQASFVAVAPGYAPGSIPFGAASVTAVHFNPVGNGNGTITFADSQNDYAVLHLSRSFAGLGVMGLEADYPGGTVTVSGYPSVAGGHQISVPQQVTVNPDYSLLDDFSIGAGSSGGPLWVTDGGTTDVVGVTSSSLGGVGSQGFAAQITSAALSRIEGWVAEDDGTRVLTAPITVLDTTTNAPVPATSTPYSGPVAGLENQYIGVSSDSVNVTVATPDWFVHTGSGTDAIAVSSGTNVLDGGTGSNFLTGGTGADTFFVDDRGATASIWSTVGGLHAGDSATLWGVTQAADSLVWADGQGAAGYTGLTLHATPGNGPTASLTLTGFSSADLANGRLSVSFGTDRASGSAYMFVHDNS